MLFNVPEDVTSQAKSNFEQALKFTQTATEATEKLFDLNVQTAKAASADVVSQIRRMRADTSCTPSGTDELRISARDKREGTLRLLLDRYQQECEIFALELSSGAVARAHELPYLLIFFRSRCGQRTSDS